MANEVYTPVAVGPTVGKRAQEQMRRAIADFGFLIPIVGDGNGRIIVGYRS